VTWQDASTNPDAVPINEPTPDTDLVGEHVTPDPQSESNVPDSTVSDASVAEPLSVQI